MLMNLLTLYVAVLATSVLLDRRGVRVPLLVAMVPLLALDCLANLVLLQSWRKTLSGEAWHQREHKHWGWCYRFINRLFFWQANHCRSQAEREARWGSVWAAWWRNVRGLPL